MLLPFISILITGFDAGGEFPGSAPPAAPRDKSLYIQCRVCGGTGINQNHLNDIHPCEHCTGTGKQKIR